MRAATGLLVIACLVVWDPGPAESRRTSKSRGGATADARSALSLEAPIRALRGALDLRSAGRTREAAKALAEVAARHPILSDHAEYLRAELLLEGGQAAEAAASCLRALEARARSPLRSDLYELLGRARTELGDEAGAQAAWGVGIEQTRDGERQARLRLALAESYQRSDQDAKALETYRKIWIDHAGSEQAAAAAAELERLESKPGAGGRSAHDWRKHADKLVRVRHNESALAAYDHSLELGLKRSEADRARKQRAHVLFRLRRYGQAVAAFTALPQHDDVPLWRARSMARADQVYEAVDEFEALAERSRGEIGIRALYLAGLLLDGRSKHERAERNFTRVARNRISPGLSRAALWRLGWAAFRSGNDERALAQFDHLIDQQANPIDRLRTRYWRARSLERLGRAEAQAEFTAMAEEFPLSYYGWRARTRAVPTGERAMPEPLDRGVSELTPEDLARPRILLAAGLWKEAADELRYEAIKAKGLADRLALAQLFSEAAQYHEAQRLIIGSYAEELSRGPVAQLEELWWLAWPDAYAEDVRLSTSSPQSVEPALVFAIMREESGYRPRVLSTSGARGLLQIMIPTGERLARSLGEEGFDADDLFVPSTNIRLGAHYLAELSRRFDGRLSASIASYNAGPKAVAGWLGVDAPGEDDEWVEAIPYDQTRGYVKRVLRSMHVYRLLY